MLDFEDSQAYEQMARANERMERFSQQRIVELEIEVARYKRVLSSIIRLDDGIAMTNVAWIMVRLAREALEEE